MIPYFWDGSWRRGLNTREFNSLLLGCLFFFFFFFFLKREATAFHSASFHFELYPSIFRKKIVFINMLFIHSICGTILWDHFGPEAKTFQITAWTSVFKAEDSYNTKTFPINERTNNTKKYCKINKIITFLSADPTTLIFLLTGKGLVGELLCIRR